MTNRTLTDLYKPSIVLDFKGTKVGIIGFVTKDTPVSETTSLEIDLIHYK